MFYILNPVNLKLEKLVICTCGIAKFETGALYITHNYIINDSSPSDPGWTNFSIKRYFDKNVNTVCCAAFLKLVSFQAQRQHLKGSIYH